MLYELTHLLNLYFLFTGTNEGYLFSPSLRSSENKTCLFYLSQEQMCIIIYSDTVHATLQENNEINNNKDIGMPLLVQFGLSLLII